MEVEAEKAPTSLIDANRSKRSAGSVEDGQAESHDYAVTYVYAPLEHPMIRGWPGPE